VSEGKALESMTIDEVRDCDSMSKAIEEAIRTSSGLFGSVSVQVAHDALNDRYTIGVQGIMQEKEAEEVFNKDAPGLPERNEKFCIPEVAVEAIYAYRSLLAASETFPGLEKLVRLVGALGISGPGVRAYLSDYIQIAPEDFLAIRAEENPCAIGGDRG
jgi:hypothetical protein